MNYPDKDLKNSGQAFGKISRTGYGKGLNTSRRSALLGLVGIAGTSFAVSAGLPTSRDPESRNECESRHSGISHYIDQFSHPLPEPVLAKEELARAGTANLWYRDTGGEGDVVILLHPSNLSGHCWGYQERSFSDAGYRVLSYSRRGYRGSDTGSASDTNDAVDDLLAFVDFLKIGRFHLVSSAGGGAVGAGYASRHWNDKRLASLVVSCSLPMFEKSPDAPGKIIMHEKFKEFRGTPKHLRGLGTSYRDVNAPGVAKWIEMSAQAAGDAPLDMTRVQPFGAISSLSEFAKIKVPTLYLAGSADLFCTPILMNDCAKVTPGAETAIINGAGHTAFWETPKEFDAIVLNHMDR